MFTEEKRLIRLEDTNNSHNKFYEVEIRLEPSNIEGVWVHWGRIGNKGSWQHKKNFNFFHSAKAYAEKIVQSKKDRGYMLKGEKPQPKKADIQPSKPKKKVDEKYARFIALLE